MKSALVVGIALAATPAWAQPLRIMDSTIRFDTAAQTVSFELDFNHKPDFFTLDAGGRQADSWQINLDIAPGYNGFGGTSPYPWETIIRGEEIHVNDDIRIRDHVLGPSPDPVSGGWGPLTGAVPYTITDKRQKFTVPFNLLNTQTGTFRFEIETYQYGQVQSHTIKGGSIPAIPAPAATGVLGIGGMVAFRRRR
ncbi:MAG: hypothetical protein IT437_05955 [Phycisphaerales bacterium]|nr:hypothetical protein [Phycisphaerales bacterium]